MYDFIVILLIVGPYVYLLGLYIYEHTEFGRRREIKGYSEELIKLLIDVNYNYFKYTINTWCEIYNKKIVDNKLVSE